MTKAVFSLAMSLMVMSSDLRALSLNMYWQPYRSGRSKTWLKTKCFTQSTFVVIGTDRDRKTEALRALLTKWGPPSC